jgi:hypothetical protein
MNRRMYPRETAEKLKMLLLVEKDAFERLTATKTKPSKRVTLFFMTSHAKAMKVGYLGSMREWEAKIKGPLD